MSRVVISGAGVVSPLGTGLAEFFAGLHAGERGVGLIRSFDTRYFPTALGAEARANGEVICGNSSQDRKAQFIRTALAELWQHSAIATLAPAQRVLHLGTGIDYFDFPGYVASKGARDWHEYSLRSSRVVDQLAAEFAVAGGHSANVAACVASSQALGASLRMVRRDPTLALLSGGFDSMLSHLHYMGFYNLGALSNWQGDPAGACRPFDRQRCGLVIGEGAAAYLLQSAEHADPVSILCELAGYGSTMDAYMVTDPEPSGQHLARAAVAAIRDAGITPDDIDVVDLHGTGTIKNALAEARALEIVFPSRWREIPAFALKGQIGHLIGACGAMEILGVIDMLKHQRVLPSVNCDEPDPDLPLRLVRGEPLAMPITHVLKLNAAFGGQNTALVIRKHD